MRRNDNSSKECSAKLNVRPDLEKNKVPPEFQLKLEDQECWEGETVQEMILKANLIRAQTTGEIQSSNHWRSAAGDHLAQQWTGA